MRVGRVIQSGSKDVWMGRVTRMRGEIQRGSKDVWMGRVIQRWMCRYGGDLGMYGWGSDKDAWVGGGDTGSKDVDGEDPKMHVLEGIQRVTGTRVLGGERK